MKCQYCGAEIKKGYTVCEYCGSAIDNMEEASDSDAGDNGRAESVRIVSRVIYRIIIALVIMGALMIFAVLPIVKIENRASLDCEIRFADSKMYSGKAASLSIPNGEENLTGIVASYSEEGVLSIKYDGNTYDNITVLNQELIDWLNETGRTLKGIEIQFATDEKGNIEKLAMLSEVFLILEEDSGYYTACRGDQIIRFTSDVPLEMDSLYCGYFCYPKLHLMSARPESPLSHTYMDPRCESKKSVTIKDAYSGEELTVYMLCSAEKWYYCNHDIYETVQEGDSLEDYLYYDEPPCIMLK